MRNLILTAMCAGIVGAPAFAAAQTPPAAPPKKPIIETGATAKAVRGETTSPSEPRAGTASPSIAKRDGGGPNSPISSANEVLNSIRSVCTLVENDGKLFAACDNTTPAARLRSGPSYLPQLITEWELFAKKLVEADWTANGKRRPVVVLNNGEVIAESTAGGVVKLKK